MSDSEQPEAPVDEGETPGVNEGGDTPAAEAAVEEPKEEEVATEEPKEEAAAEEPKEEAAAEEPKEEAAVEEVKEEAAVEATEEAAVEAVEEVAVEEGTNEEVATEQPADEAATAEPTGEGADQPQGEEWKVTEEAATALAETAEGDADGELTLDAPVEGAVEGEVAAPKEEGDGDDITLAPPVEEEGEEAQGEGAKEGEGGEGEGEGAVEGEGEPKGEKEGEGEGEEGTKGEGEGAEGEGAEGEGAEGEKAEGEKAEEEGAEGEKKEEEVKGEGAEGGEGAVEGEGETGGEKDKEGEAEGEEGTKKEGEGAEGEGAEGEKGAEEVKAEGAEGEEGGGEKKVKEEGEAAEGEKVEEVKEQKKEKKKKDKIREHREDSIDDETVEMETAGDFDVRHGSDESGEAFAFDADVAVSSSSEEEAEEVVEEEVPEELQIDREAYTEQYRQLLHERTLLKRRNALLQKKLVEHYKKRKMENVYKDVLPQAVDLESRYSKKLLAYDDMRTIEEQERYLVNTDLTEMRKQRDVLAHELQEALDALVQKERETGTGLINAKTGKPIADKLIDRMLKRQVNKCKDIAKCRLKFIKLRDKVTLKEQALKDLETLGDNLHLIDYEQLRMENQNLSDKIEERDDELTRLRYRTTECIQILAHIREKSHATLTDIETQKELLKDVEDDVTKTREELNRLKRKRDNLREETLRNQEEAGLLTKPKLLRDYEESIDLLTVDQARLQAIQKSYQEEARALAIARESLAEHEAEFRNMQQMCGPRGRRRAQFAGVARRRSQEAGDGVEVKEGEDGDEDEPVFQMK